MKDNIDTIKQAFADFMVNELLGPLVERYFELGYDFTHFHRLTEPLADYLNEYYPEYYAGDYTAHVGQYFFASLYSESLEEDVLFEFLKNHADDENNDGIKGLHLLFSESMESVKYNLKTESIREMRLFYYDVDDIITLMVLELLNSGKIIKSY